MSQCEIMKQNLLKEINDYMVHLLYIKDVNAVYEHISDMKTDKLNKSPNFVLIVECALYDSLVMALARLYDKSKKAKTIPGLIGKCLTEKYIFLCQESIEIKLNIFQNELVEDEDLANAIKILQERRDIYYAHNDNQYFGIKGNKDTTYLPMYKLWSLIRYTEKVLKYLLEQLSSEPLPKCKYDNDLEKLLR